MESRHRDEEMHLAYEREQAVKAEAIRLEAAIAAAEGREKARETRERELRDLRLKVTQQQAWQRNVERAARKAVVINNGKHC